MKALALAFAAVPLFALAVRAASPLVADLSQHLVAITTGFAGAELLLFGAIEQPGDVVVTVHGPYRSATMHRKSRVAGIWMNTAQMTFDHVPTFYTVASSRPLDKIASKSVLARHQMGVDNLRLELPSAKASPNVADEWREALIRSKQRQGLYPVDVGHIAFLGSRLFRTSVEFPANVPTGIYQVSVYLIQDGVVESAQTTPLLVSKVGLEAEIFDLAHNESALYGVIAVLVALVAGWLGHLAFRRS